MVNPFKDVDWKPGREQGRAFARSLMIGFPCLAVALAVILRWRSGAWMFEIPLLLGAAGLVLGVVLLLLPPLVRPFYVVWYAVACSIGLVLGNLLLAAVYYLVVTPTAVVRRRFRRQPFRKRIDRSAGTYWIDLEKPAEPDRYYRQY